jgi:hypothetical protein
MKNLLGSVVGSELFFVYGLIALVIILIIVIVVMDRIESKKKPKNLFDTLNMKIISEPEINNLKEQEENNKEDITPEVVEINQDIKQTTFQDIESIPEVTVTKEDTLLDEEEPSLSEEDYVETDLEKTQAQIRVEEITSALKNAKVDEKIEEDKYAKFEEEQEKNAIISYEELMNSFDKLYNENEKIQYLEDDEIPINISELYELSSKQETNQEELPKVKLDDLSSFNKNKEEEHSTFKSSPLISPVYGIQKPPVENNPVVEMDTDIQNANQFLKNLKELKNNLD